MQRTPSPSRLSPKSTVNRGLLQGGEGVLLARRMRMLCWLSKRLRCFGMVKDAFHPIVTSSFFFAGHPHPSAKKDALALVYEYYCFSSPCYLFVFLAVHPHPSPAVTPSPAWRRPRGANLLRIDIASSCVFTGQAKNTHGGAFSIWFPRQRRTKALSVPEKHRKPGPSPRGRRWRGTRRMRMPRKDMRRCNEASKKHPIGCFFALLIT